MAKKGYITVTFNKQCSVDGKLYKKGEYADIPLNAATIYKRLNKLVFGKVKKAEKAEADIAEEKRLAKSEKIKDGMRKAREKKEKEAIEVEKAEKLKEEKALEAKKAQEEKRAIEAVNNETKKVKTKK